jgi:hypothetical protein
LLVSASILVINPWNLYAIYELGVLLSALQRKCQTYLFFGTYIPSPTSGIPIGSVSFLRFPCLFQTRNADWPWPTTRMPVISLPFVAELCNTAVRVRAQVSPASLGPRWNFRVRERRPLHVAKGALEIIVQRTSGWMTRSVHPFNSRSTYF